MTRSEIYKIRYQIYRDLGYSPAEARAMRGRSLDVSVLKVDPSTKKVVKNRAYKAVSKSMTGPKDINKFKNRAWRVKNDTIYSRWGMLTQDDRYRNQTDKIKNFIRTDLKISDDQAYYFLYYMTTNKKTYAQAKIDLLGNIEFEDYDKKKRGKRK